MRKSKHSIRNKIVLWAVGFSLILALMVAAVSFVLSARYLRQNQQQSALTSLHVLGNSLDSDMNAVLTFSNWICLDSTLCNYLQSIDKAYLQDTSAGRKLSLSAWNHLNNEFNIIGVRNSVERVVVSTTDGSRFLQSVSTGTAQTTANAPGAIMDASFFEPMVSSSSYQWIGIVPNPMGKGSTDVIPVLRAIQSPSTGSMIGWVYMDIPISVITSSLKGYILTDDDALYLTFSPGYSYRFDKGTLKRDGIPSEAISYTLPDTGWVLSYLPSRSALLNRMNSYALMIVGIFMVIMLAGILLSIMLQSSITKPVEMIIKRLGRIGQGDFTRDSNIEWENELGQIGRGINNLSENVSDLMEKRLLDEKTRHDLEYQVLQSQINPHFLYNTLNTIKWMATIQGSEGISDMATALSRLMKNISKGSKELIPLKDEFSLVDDYFTIMKYRYGGTIEMEYQTDDPLLVNQRINRFSLQPIVENAIFHGIEPKQSAGRITIHTYRKDAYLYIDVTDNGIGMTKDAIEAVLSGKSRTSNEFFKQIGVVNVNERIRYTFGEEYGIHIISTPGEYTTMSFVLPYREEITQE